MFTNDGKQLIWESNRHGKTPARPTSSSPIGRNDRGGDDLNRCHEELTGARDPGAVGPSARFASTSP